MSEREASEAFLGSGVLFGAITTCFAWLGTKLDDVPALLAAAQSAYLFSAVMAAIAVYCLYVAYCGLAD